jgi:1-acyl-sn-glycerol-3-phosphate acyltransferase
MIVDYSRWKFQRDGWTVRGDELAQYRRCVVTAAGHTSNWDAIYMIAAFHQMKLRMRFTVKEEWMRFPFRSWMEAAGGLAINRAPRTGDTERPSMTQSMVRLFEDTPGDLALVITPEGTRSLRKEWKTGFWHVAKQANVPILLGYIDYAKKEAGIGAVIHPTDLETDMRAVTRFYATVTPKFPELFQLDERYVDAVSSSD